MKLKMVVVDLELSKRAKRIAAAVLVPVLVMAGGAIAYANVPHTWKDGDTLTASDLNSNFADLDGRVSTLQAPSAKLSYTGIESFTIPTQAMFVTVPYTTKLYDDRGEFDTTTHAFTAKTAGDFEICASLSVAQTVAGAQLDLFVNGVREHGLADGIAGNYTFLTGCRTVRLAAGDVVDVRAWQPGTTAVSVTTDPFFDWITIYERR